jgi:hypothetical protein
MSSLLPIRRMMLEPEKTGRAKSVQEHYTRAVGAIGGGIQEITFSMMLSAPAALGAPKPAATGTITWSFIASPRLELVDMYVDVA